MPVVKLLIPFLLSLLFIACGCDSSTSANDSDDDVSSKSSSSRKTVSSSSDKVIEHVDPADVIVASMTDARDGQTYKTVKIGAQTWMAENLNYEKANSYCYNDDSANCAKYGRLYTWAAAVGKPEDECGYEHVCYLDKGDVRGVCPEGWHLPSRAEWAVLIVAVDGYITEYKKENTAGEVLMSTFGWTRSSKSVYGTDAFSFSALPAGDRDWKGDSCDEGENAYFWSSTEDNGYNAYIVSLTYISDYAFLYYFNNKNYALSVRCLKD